MEFTGATTAWAADVARHLDRFAGHRVPSVDDLWVTDSPALLVRYRLGDLRLAARAQLDRDPTSWDTPTDSERLASNLLHSLHAPGDIEWTDDDRYGWWGDPPAEGWAALSAENRVTTVR